VSPARPSAGQQVALGAIVLLCLFGIGVGAYMSWHHEMEVYGPAGSFGEILGCAEAEGVSCKIVNTSEWSELFGVPQFTWAIPTYVTMAALALFAAFREKQAAALVFAMAVGCVVYSAFLAYISKVELNTWCLWCIRLYATNGLILALSAYATVGAWKPGRSALMLGAATMVASTVVAVGVQKQYRATLLPDDIQTAELTKKVADTTAKDADGPAPVLSWTVKTEDGNEATLTTSPDDPWKGNRDSKVAVVEFADFECGFCKRASGELKRLEEAYGDRVVFIYKHFPMDPTCNPGVRNKKHRYACQAAEASVCMQAQGLFWPFHDLAFKNQHQLKANDLIAYVNKVGGDEAAFRNCMVAKEGAAKVRADAEMGASLDQHGTPRIWVDGKLYRAGQSAEQMARALELALGASAQEAASNAVQVRSKPVDIAPIPADVPEMRTITKADGTTFEIDTFEAGLANGAATVGKHQIPGTRMSWYAARDACAKAGKRLCTEEEWVTACQGRPASDDDGDGAFADDMVEGTTYPYSDYHTRGRCWDGQDRSLRPVYTGEMPGCVSTDGVYDLTGNVEEWVGSTPETAVLLGGAFDTSKDHARCYRRNDTFGAGYANARTGFRCCR
jgi:protein-disulfide isomerase